MMDKPDSWQDLVAGMSAEVHDRLKTAVELGKWENGERLSPEQVEYCMQAIIAWDHMHLPESERVAYIDRTKTKQNNGND